jgi:mono/diheme cytochrome c family protein
MPARYTFLFGILLLLTASAGADNKNPAVTAQFPPTYVPSGRQLYQEYCAACHGADAKGHGPATSSLKRPPADLTTLANRHGGNFPYDYVTNVLLFGPGISAHGSANMPTWGPIFLYLDSQNEPAARQRIKNLCDYLASLQVGQKTPKREPVSGN